MTLRIGSLDIPLPHRTAARLKQFKLPARTSRFRDFVRRRRHNRDLPAAGGGQRFRARFHGLTLRRAQHEGGDTGFLGGQLQAAAGRKRDAAYFADDASQHRMAQAFLHGGEDVGVGCACRENQPRRIEAHLRKAWTVDIESAEASAPQHRAAGPGKPPGQSRAECGYSAESRRASVAADFMQTAQRQALFGPEPVYGRQQGERFARAGRAAPAVALDLADSVFEGSKSVIFLCIFNGHTYGLAS